ncbi:MAG: 5'-nucleotidase, lipoprotein e(P4) family [Candidatus Cloacimonetes bacterium]|nr:5'-nucleotidase, lipoprotein e(P4) family [Candidatus Cloacimonadota bacterium]
MKKSIINLIVVISTIISLSFLGCFNSKVNKPKNVENQDLSISSLENEALLMAVLWHQTSAEYRALAYQAFNIARMKLDEELKIKRELPKAIIIDIDETLIDNSPYNAKGVFKKQDYPEEFYEWIDMAKAKAIPGAKEFLNYADKKEVDIFYVSNRRIICLKGTIKQLKELDFPQIEKGHILLREDVSSKEERRQIVAKDYYVVLLIGDNLDDFAKIFEKKSITDRLHAAEKYKEDFGNKFIVLPNIMHGSWKKALYNYKKITSKDKKTKARLDKLKTY